MKLGPRVLGDEEFKRQQEEYEAAKQRGFVYGSRVAGQAPPPVVEKPTDHEPTTDAGPEPATGGLSLAKLEEKLDGELSDALLDDLILAEFEREGEPRKGALRLLLKAEQSRGEAARSAIVTELQGALKE